MSSLDRYRDKRDFNRTPEPAGEGDVSSGKGGPLRFVIQKHDATRLHYDLRLEHEGVLLSWAVPKGPSLDPTHKRLAVRTENHPLDYAGFEGIIPRGQYGAGTMIVWDRGTWTPDPDKNASDMLEHGRLHFSMTGDKVKGKWHLIRTRNEQWLLMKDDDEVASDARPVLVEARPESVISGRTLEEVEAMAGEGGAVDDDDDDASEEILGRLEALEGAVPVETVPDIVEPQLAKLAGDPPRGDKWLHEIKLDGYRLLAHVDGKAVTLRTRNGKDFTKKLPAIGRAFAAAGLGPTVFDGELCVIDESTGRTSFAKLQGALSTDGTDTPLFMVFDAPYATGFDLRAVKLEDRKQVLRALLGRHLPGHKTIRYCKHVRGSGPGFFENACQLGLEGVISKRADAKYVHERASTWKKLKVPQAARFYIGGYTRSTASHRAIRSVLVGERSADGSLVYRGKVGSGFTDEQLDELSAHLERRHRGDSPFSDGPKGREAKEITWVEPTASLTAVYAEITDAGKLRHARLKSLHLDGAGTDGASGAADAPAPSRGGGVRLTHPKRLIDEQPPFSKRDFAGYVMQICDWILPHVSDRPLTLIRGLDGVGGKLFFQRHRMEGAPAALQPLSITDEDGEAIHATIDDPLGLVALVQIGAVEFHTWTSHRDRLETPDRLVFDLDPDRDLDYARVVEAAFEIRRRLVELGLRSFVKTTGGKGLHVVAPIEPKLGFSTVKAAAKAFARRMAEDAPQRYTINPKKSERKGKLYLDYLRNGRGATYIAPYSPRAKPGLPVSTPVAWDELDEHLRPDAFSVHDVAARLAGLDADPWAQMDTLEQRLTGEMLHALGVEP